MKTTFNKTNTTVFLEGALTKYNFSKLLENVQELIKMRECEIILDCMHLKTIDSLGLGTLISLAESAHKRGIKLYLIGLHNTVISNDTTTELKEYVANALDISNKVKKATGSLVGVAAFAPKTPAIKRV